MARVISRECGIPAEKIRVMPNLLDEKEFNVDRSRDDQKKEITVLHVGRMERVKGIQVLAEAIPEVLAAHPNVRFVFIGDDGKDENGISWKKKLEDFFRGKGVAHAVSIFGGVDQQTLLAWYAKTDIAVVPSLNYESFSYTCAQAMAAGLPVVASRIGGISETVDDGKSGMLIEPGNFQKLAEALIRLTRDPDLRLRMGQAGRERTRRCFGDQQIARQFLEVVETLIRPPGIKSINERCL